MLCTAAQVMEFTEQEDVQFVRLAFFDVLGHLKTVSVSPCQLHRAFTRGIPFDPSGIKGFEHAGNVLLLCPAADTCAFFAPEKTIRMYCSICDSDGTPFPADSRALLHRADQAAAKMGLSLRFSGEYTFYFFTTDADGNPSRIPHDRAGYMDAAPPDKGAQLRREICVALEGEGIFTRLSQHHRGPGQHLIRWCTGSAMETADTAASLCGAVHAVAQRHGLHASFAPSPLPKEEGNGLHIRVSATHHTEAFLAGIQTHLRDMTVFFNPTQQSYERLHMLRTENRTPVSVLDADGIILTAPDPAANPYILLTLLIYAGLDGIRRGLVPAAEFALNKLPCTMEEASRFAAISDFIGSVLPRQVTDAYLQKQ